MKLFFVIMAVVTVGVTVAGTFYAVKKELSRKDDPSDFAD